MSEQNKNEKDLAEVIRKLTSVIVLLLFVIVGLLIVLVHGVPDLTGKAPYREVTVVKPKEKNPLTIEGIWKPPDTSTIPHNELGSLIRYGRDLVANTAYYLGPKGTVGHYSSGMNCQNCHLDAGTRPFAYNYSAVTALYPKFMVRTGRTTTIFRRVNDCFERSLNGHALDTNMKEMQAIKAYIVWLDQNSKKGEKPKGYGYLTLAFMDRPADTAKGRIVFTDKCISCHGKDGMGMMKSDGMVYQYPPLWGDHSYNKGASFFWLTRFAGFVKANMPFGQATYDNPVLTDEEAWDVAAYVDSRERTMIDLHADWKNLSDKPFDFPFGPYADGFSESQHKY